MPEIEIGGTNNDGCGRFQSLQPPVKKSCIRRGSMKVEFYRHSLDKSDMANVTKVLESTFLTTGPVTVEFEKRFGRYTGLKEAVALNSCTGAIHLTLLALNIGPGDEVITTPMTFIASATAIMQAGATPVFVDVEPDTALMDVGRIEKAITTRTKAVLPVHLYGSMVDMKALRSIADQYGLKVIEDCAHCIEGERDGVRPGTLSEAACYSFYATKNLTCGEGGALATNDPILADKIRVLRLHGMSKDAIHRYGGSYEHWDMVALGWKYNMDDIHAALLLGQLDRLDDCLEKRIKIWKAYDSALAGIAGVDIPETRGVSARHLYTIWLEPKKRDDFLRLIQLEKVGVAVNYRAIHTLRFFRERFGYRPGDFPAANAIGERTVSLPLYPSMRDKEISYVCDTVRRISSIIS